MYEIVGNNEKAIEYYYRSLVKFKSSEVKTFKYILL